LNQLRRDLTLAKTELAALMDLPPRQDFTVAVPDIDALTPIRVDLSPEEIEILSLTYRPELREERYQGRISQVETRKALLRMLPGIEFDTALNFDTNSFLVNSTWAGYGARITWNLLNLIRGPAAMEAAEADVAVAEARRLAVSMAVLVQGHVAWINYHNALKDFETAEALRDVDARLRDQLAARGRAAATGDLPVIRGELELLLSDLRRDLAYAQVNNAAGAILLSIGADPLPETVADGSLETLAEAIREREAAWRRGEYLLPVPDESDAAEDPAETVRRPAVPGPGAAPAGTVSLPAATPAG
jgi:outer membrane protein TolC